MGPDFHVYDSLSDMRMHVVHELFNTFITVHRTIYLQSSRGNTFNAPPYPSTLQYPSSYLVVRNPHSNLCTCVTNSI